MGDAQGERSKIRSKLAEKLVALLSAPDADDIQLESSVHNDGAEFKFVVPKGKASLVSPAADVAAVIAQHEC